MLCDIQICLKSIRKSSKTSSTAILDAIEDLGDKEKAEISTFTLAVYFYFLSQTLRQSLN